MWVDYDVLRSMKSVEPAADFTRLIEFSSFGVYNCVAVFSCENQNCVTLIFFSHLIFTSYSLPKLRVNRHVPVLDQSTPSKLEAPDHYDCLTGLGSVIGKRPYDPASMKLNIDSGLWSFQLAIKYEYSGPRLHHRKFQQPRQKPYLHWIHPIRI